MNHRLYVVSNAVSLNGRRLLAGLDLPGEEIANGESLHCFELMAEPEIPGRSGDQHFCTHPFDKQQRIFRQALFGTVLTVVLIFFSQSVGVLGDKVVHNIHLVAVQVMAGLDAYGREPNLGYTPTIASDMAVASFSVAVILSDIDLALQIVVDTHFHIEHPFCCG